MKKIYWSELDEDYLKLHYPNTKTIELANYFKKTVRHIYQRANALGLRKSPEFLASAECGIFIKGSKIGASYRFPKGNIPANKGKKLEEFMTPKGIENSKATRFTKGNLPHNTLQANSIVKRYWGGKDVLMFRVSKAIWIPLKNKVWIDNFGDIPKGYVVRLKDGNYENCIPENLECITKRENMERNSIMRYPKELIPLVKLNSKLKKQIKQYEHNK